VAGVYSYVNELMVGFFDDCFTVAVRVRRIFRTVSPEVAVLSVCGQDTRHAVRGLVICQYPEVNPEVLREILEV
jgi:hypothetical protein